MSDKPENPPAFPFIVPDGGICVGMTLRDYFAAQASHMFQLDNDDTENLCAGIGTPRHDIAAKFCYQLADAMLKARKEGNNE